MSAARVTTSSAPSPVALRYDAVFVDLDGVIYRGDRALPAAPGTLEHLRASNVRLLFLTNNSARTPQQVAERMSDLGVPAEPREVLTSALATATMLRSQGAAGSTAFVIGERGVREALADIGIEVLDGEPQTADLVVVGWDRGVDYSKLRTASLLVERGARLVATNPDASFPASDGLWPGAGAILAAITTTTGATPTIVGKPARPLFQAAAEATGAARPLIVGDRLDTDIGGANAMTWDSMLVLSGASTPWDLLDADETPTYVAPDVGGLVDDLSPARFRPAAPEDAAAIASLLRSGGLPADGVEERIDDTIVSGARPGKGIDATASLQILNGFAILRSVAVRPSLQGKGLGMLAAAAAFRRARTQVGGGSQPVRQVALFTETAQPFFERLGFRKVDRSDLPEAVLASRHAREDCAGTGTAMVRDVPQRSQ